MDVEYETLFVEDIPQDEPNFPCLNVRCGTRLIAILGILFGFACAAMLLVKDRKNLNTATITLVVFLSIFVIVTVMFVLASVLLLMAALDEDPDLISYYVWLSIVFLCVQLVLAIVIPLVLIAEGNYPVSIALIWMIIVLIVSLGWTHFISEVSLHRALLMKMVDF